MANKFWKNAGDALKHQTAAKPAAPDQTQKLLSRLDQVFFTLDDPRKRLSSRKIEELNMAGVIKYTSQGLRSFSICDAPQEALAKRIAFLIEALNMAVMDGMEKTAEWACTALVFAVKDLGTHAESTRALWERRVEYAGNLEQLVRCCIEHDQLAAQLAEQQQRRQRTQEELDQRKNDFQTRRDSGELDDALAMLATHAHHPAMLPHHALVLKQELDRMHMLQDELTELDAHIAVKQRHLEETDAHFRFLRGKLSAPPATSSI